jgi:hypothetical protein
MVMRGAGNRLWFFLNVFYGPTFLNYGLVILQTPGC